MQNIKEFYILGIPIDTPLGQAKFVKVKELPDFAVYQNLLAIPREKIINIYIDSIADINSTDKQKAYDYLVKNLTYYDLIVKIKELNNLYTDLFKFVFNEDVFDKIDASNFDYYKQLIMNMNCIQEETFNSNPEIQKWIEKSKNIKLSNEKLEFQDMVSSIVVYTGYKYYEINELTLYQFYINFQRIGVIINYFTSCLFATVSTEKINIDSWCKHIDLFEKPKTGVSREEYNRLKGGIFGGD